MSIDIIDGQVMCRINTIDEELADIRGLAQLGPLLDTAGRDYYSHGILLLSLIDRAAQAAAGASAELVRRLRMSQRPKIRR